MCAESQAISDMFRLVHGYSARGKAVMVIGYFDGSGTHDGSQLWAICGFLGDQAVWEDFDERWNRILDKKDWPQRPKEFHMFDCVHAFQDFEGWTLAQRLALFGDLASVVCDSPIMALGSMFVVAAFDGLDSSEKALLAKGGLTSPLDFAFQYLVQTALTWTRRHSDACKIPPQELGLIFDVEPPQVAERYHALYNHHVLKHPHGKMLSGIGFADSAKFTPVQAADMLAYTTYHWQLKQLSPSLSDFDFPVIPGFLRIIENVAADGGIYNASALRQLMLGLKINAANQDARY